MLPVPFKEKDAPPDDFTGHDGRYATDADVRAWVRDRAADNVCVRMPSDVVGIDVDAYGDKHGDETLAELEKRLGKLPPAYRITSRDPNESVSGIYLFGVPPGVEFKGKAGKSIEVISWSYRYAVAPPSVHPEGRTYKLYSPDGADVSLSPPTPMDLVALPDKWLQYLTKGAPALSGTGEPTVGWASRVRKKFTAIVAELAGNHHDTALEGSLALVGYCKAGHAGAHEALELAHSAFVDSVVANGSRTREKAEAEWQRMIDGAERIVGVDLHDAACDTDDVVYTPDEPMANARLFVAQNYSHPDHVTIMYRGGTFELWNGRAWPVVESQAVKSHLYCAFEDKVYQAFDKKAGEMVGVPFNPNAFKVRNLMEALEAVTFEPKSLASPTWLSSDAPYPPHEVIAMHNGLLHYPTRTLVPHTPLYYSPFSIPFDYAEDAGPPTRWLQFVREVLGDDESSIECLQEWFGHLLRNDTRQQKMLLLIGVTRSGKGTAMRVLEHLVGRENVVGGKLSSLGHNFGLQPLIGKPVAILADVRMNSADDRIIEALLTVSGEDIQTINRKNTTSWSGKLPTRFVLLSNETPVLKDDSGALARRFVVIHFPNSFYGKEDTELTDKLVAEAPAIFNWALDGLDRLRERGHFVQPKSALELVSEMEDLGSPVRAFFRDRCQMGGEVTMALMYAAYQHWCSEQGKRAWSAPMFGKALRTVVPGLRVRQTGTGEKRERTYTGVDLTSEWRQRTAPPPPVEDLTTDEAL